MAETAAPKSKDEKVLAMSTRRYIDSNLQASLVQAVKALHQYRPAADQLQSFMLAAMEPAKTAEAKAQLKETGLLSPVPWRPP